MLANCGGPVKVINSAGCDATNARRSSALAGGFAFRCARTSLHSGVAGIEAKLGGAVAGVSGPFAEGAESQ